MAETAHRAGHPQNLPEVIQRLDQRALKHQHNAKPFTWMGHSFPSLAAFCRSYGLSGRAVRYRLGAGITDERLIERNRLGSS